MIHAWAHFLWKIIIFQNKKELGRRVTVFYIFAMSGLIEDIIAFIPTSSFNLLSYVVLFKAYEKSSFTYIYVISKRRHI